MAQEKIKVTIRKDGSMQIGVEGIQGKNCIEATEDLEVYLGKTKERELTTDYYKHEPKGPETWISRK